MLGASVRIRRGATQCPRTISWMDAVCHRLRLAVIERVPISHFDLNVVGRSVDFGCSVPAPDWVAWGRPGPLSAARARPGQFWDIPDHCWPPMPKVVKCGLNLEVGTARSLRRRVGTIIDVLPDNDRRCQGRRALAVESAHTYLPEAATECLLEVARAEVVAGLSGRLRLRIAPPQADPRAGTGQRQPAAASTAAGLPRRPWQATVLPARGQGLRPFVDPR